MSSNDPTSRRTGGLIRVLPESVTGPDAQNPAPLNQVGQVDESRVRAIADQITTIFINSLPSNYVSQVKGPNYAQNFQAVAEELARIQVASEDAYEDADFRFTRSEVLWQFLGSLIFPTAATTGMPDLDGDVTYREFLHKMVTLLLRGSRGATLLEGVEALTDAEVSILEKADFIGQPAIGWTVADRFTFEVNVSKHRRTTPDDDHYHTVKVNASGDGETLETIGADAHTHTISGFLVSEAEIDGVLPPHTHDLLSDFADLPITLARNVEIVLRALRPGHTIFEYRNLFRETFRHVFTDLYYHVELDGWYYEDFRKNCAGIKEIVSDGTVLSDRYTLNDTVSFRSVRSGAVLDIEYGLNAGRYEVKSVLSFPYGDDPVARPYTTSPSGLSGTAIVEDGAIVDAAQDWALAEPGEILTFTSGPNAGRYILETLLGSNGGPLGQAPGPATRVRPAPCFLRVRPRFEAAESSNPYTVEIDRLGVRRPITIAWEDVSEQFFAPPAVGLTTFQTAHGPLVRPFGDATPATRADVQVFFDGTPVDVADVNPYAGVITLANPIAAFAPGDHTVEITYTWFPSPTMGMAGLNTQGLTLNKWSLGGNRNVTSPPTTELGGFRTTRFPMNVALGRFPSRRNPLRIAHRFIAFEKAYTAALNSPTLLLNAAPGRVSVPYARVDIEPRTFQYEGRSIPQEPWVAHGSFVGIGDGDTYELFDTDPTAVGYWSHDFELPIPSMVGAAARLRIDSFTLDGVFTGVGFGFYNNRRFYLAGALVVNGLKHVGVLARPGELHDLSSWIVGPRAAGTVRSSSLVTCSLDEAPKLLGAGQRFQILEGAQTGVYTISQVVIDRRLNLASILIDGSFPANPDLFGNRDVSLVFETLWDAGLSTWRLYADTRSQAFRLIFGGSTGGQLVSIDGGPVLASPAYLGPDILPEGSGRFVWGSLSRSATNQSVWDFVRFLSTPDGASKFARGTVVDTTMGENPEDEDWFLLSPFGDSQVNAGILRLTATPASDVFDSSYGYGLVDPFLNGRRISAFDAHVRASRDTSGAGGVALVMKDGAREARLGTLLYQDDGTKSIFSQATISLIGATGYEAQGWLAVGDPGFGSPSVFANGPETRISGSGEDSWALVQELGQTVGDARTLEFRLAMGAYTSSGGGVTGLSFLANVSNRTIALVFISGGLALVDANTGFPVVTIGLDWTDGEPRTYRLEIDPVGDTVDLFVDDVGSASTTFSAFPIFITDDNLAFGYFAEDGASFEAQLSSLTFMEDVTGIPNLHRTFGLWRGGDPSDINNWKVPRTDGLNVPNSDAASVIVEMDWRLECWIRLFIDPTFGVGFLRPDLNPPSGYTGDFATQSMDPSAAWATLEYSRLPRAVSDTRFGSVYFGGLNPIASSLSYWSEVRYRVFTHTSIDYRAPQRMALNQWNVITSGDYLRDHTPEQVVVASLTATRVSLRPAHIVANRVFQVIVEGIPLRPDEWRFNGDSQEITLFTPLPEANFPISVVFAPGKPITTTYLATQPLPESQTILNEGTPPVPLGKHSGKATISTVSGDGGPVPEFPPAGPADPNYFLRDAYLVRQFEDDPEHLYEQMQFFQLEDGGARGVLSTFCDSSGAGNGVREFDLGGRTFTEILGSPASPDLGRGAGTSRSVLHASGGLAGVMGLLGPASYTTPFSQPDPTPTGLEASMLYPSGPSAGVVPGSDGGAVNRQVFWILRLGASPGSILSNAETLDETVLIEGSIDNPIIDPDSDQDAWYEMASAAEYPRLGPWVGLASLTTNSLLYGSSSAQPSGVPASGIGMILQGGSALPIAPAPVVGTL